MYDFARQLVEKTEAGKERTISLGSTEGIELERFQVLVVALEKLETEGRIQLLHKHQETQTGHRLVDLVKFRRLR